MRLLTHGFDWWQECLNVMIPVHLWERMAVGKAKAIELDVTRSTPIDFEFGDEKFQIGPSGAKGGREFVLHNEDLRFWMGPLNREWCVVWRATSAGLWQHGYSALRDRAYAIMEREGCKPHSNDYIRLVRADYCFDFLSAKFTTEMIPGIERGVVCPSQTKAMGEFWIQGDRMETLTIGARSDCQVQIYNKGIEITEVSGKEWMFALWREHSGYDVQEIDLGNVWRLEVRLRGDWLKNRNAKDPDRFLTILSELLTEALYNRRLTVPSDGDTNRRRWPLHPIYTAAWAEMGGLLSLEPIGYKVTGKRDALLKVMRSGIAGYMRSALTLQQSGKFTDEEMDEFYTDIAAIMVRDPDHDAKIRRAEERYENVDNAK